MKIKGKKRHFADNVGKDTLESEKVLQCCYTLGEV